MPSIFWQKKINSGIPVKGKTTFFTSRPHASHHHMYARVTASRKHLIKTNINEYTGHLPIFTQQIRLRYNLLSTMLLVYETELKIRQSHQTNCCNTQWCMHVFYHELLIYIKPQNVNSLELGPTGCKRLRGCFGWLARWESGMRMRGMGKGNPRGVEGMRFPFHTIFANPNTMYGYQVPIPVNRAH